MSEKLITIKYDGKGEVTVGYVNVTDWEAAGLLKVAVAGNEARLAGKITVKDDE